MDLSGISSSTAPTSQAAMTQQAAGAMVMRKILDIEATQGAMLAQMMAQSAGLGGTIDTRA